MSIQTLHLTAAAGVDSEFLAPNEVSACFCKPCGGTLSLSRLMVSPGTLLAPANV